MIKNGYASRNIPSFTKFEETFNTRINAKKSGDKVTANNLKLILNTCYGATLNKYNDLFDPLQARSVCISGQLYLSELANHLFTEVEGLEIISLNTDGIMIEFDDSHYDEVIAITNEWQERTGFELEEDKIKKVCQANVNNYILVMEDGTVKTKGGYLVRGIAPAGAFNVNNNATIVAKAIVDYFTLGTEVEKTIGECNDIFQFQLIAKAGSKYKEAYHLVDGKQESVQKVNRVYASKDKRYGKLFKVKAENDSTAKIESLPEHCIIDNANKLTIEDVDKTWYIELAKKRINDFLGIKPIKNKEKNKMAITPITPKTNNVYEKLLAARVAFLNSQVTKSGKNMHLAFKYFELDDIVPKATAIFEEVGILPVVSFEADKAIMVLTNVDKPDDTVTFALPLVQLTENKGTNAVQAFGATVTYYRRYLYMIALDICEPDEIDAGIKANVPTQTVAPSPVVDIPKNAAPAPVNIAPTEKPLTNADGNASEIQLKQLKEVLKKLKDADPSKEDMITKLAIETKGFTVISKADCEALTLMVGDMLKEVQ